MTTSFANRLAAGGLWTLTVAQNVLKFSEHLRETGHGPLPMGDGSPRAVFNYAGRDVFNWLIDSYLPEGHHARCDMQLQDTKFVARNGSVISEELWLEHIKDDNYRRIAYSCNPVRKIEVITIWTGVSVNDDPNVFRTLVYTPCNCSQPHPSAVALSSSEARARQMHQQMVNAVAARP